MTISGIQCSEEVRGLTQKMLKGFSSKTIENMRLKRRLLENHFKNMVSLAFTISSEPLNLAVLGGYFLQINLTSSKVLKMASEGYCLDERSCHFLSPMFYALMHLYFLQLSHVPVVFYVTSPEMMSLLQSIDAKNDPVTLAVKLLLKHLVNVTISPCVKGNFFEKMHSKIQRLKLGETNETESLNFMVLANNVLA